MPQKSHPFIDIAVLDGMREAFLRGDALVLLTDDLGEVLWANGPGAALLRLGDIEQASGAAANIPFVARRQIAAIPGFPRVTAEQAVAARLSPGTATTLLIRSIALPSGGSAVLMRVPAPHWAAGDASSRAISGIAEAGHFAALLDEAGLVLAESDGFAGLRIAGKELASLAGEVTNQSDRLAKRMIETAGGLYPAGIARLSENPARHMVIIVDDPQPIEDEEPAEAASDAVAAVAGTAADAVRAAAVIPDAAPRRDLFDDHDTWYFADQPPARPAVRRDESAGSGEPAREARGAEAPGEEAPQGAEDDTDSFDETVDGRSSEDGEYADEGYADEEEALRTSDGTTAPDLDAPSQDNREPGASDFEPAGEAIAAEADADQRPVAPEAEAEPSSALAYEPGRHDDADSEAAPAEPAAAPRPDLGSAPVRFVWKTDAQGRFSNLSDEFASAVGASAADIVGQPFRDVAQRFGFDPDGEIAGLLERRDTWSGRTVMWPVEGTDLRVPVDLAALPVYARDRSFEGFRGFGVARVGDVTVDREEAGQRLGAAAPRSDRSNTVAEEDVAEDAAPDAPAADPFRGEARAISVANDGPERRLSDKVIRLAEHRSAPSDRELSTGEKLAFEEIGARLKEAQAEPADAITKDRNPPQTSAEPDAGEAVAAEAAAERPQYAADAGAAPKEAPAEPSESNTAAPKDTQPDAMEPELAVADARSEDAPQTDADAAQVSEDDAARQTSEEAAEPVPEQSEDAHLDAAEQPQETAAAEEVEQPAEAADEEDERPARDDFVPSAFSRPAGRLAGVDTSILERLPVPVLIHSGDTLHYANQEFLELTGYGSIEHLEYSGGLGALFADPPAEDESPDADHRRRLRTRDGAEFPVEALLQSVPWHHGKALLLALKPAASAAAADTGELAELEARVAEMRTILDTATDGIVILTRDGTIRSISRPAEALFGFDNDTVAGKPFVSLFAVESQRAARDYLNGLSDHGVASVLNDGREVIGREAMGRFIPLFMTIGRLPNDSGYCAVLRDITQWKRAEEELTHARAEAERASSQKSEFLARISHEIRTPLNAIIGFSELMMDEKFGPIVNERYRDYLRDINRSGNHVLDLVNDLLDISKIEAGEQELSYEAVSLNEALAEAVAMMQPQANRDRVIIRSSYASKLPEVVADLRSVRQIALNLLSNAVRYTQAGGQVIVSTSYEPTGDVAMRVRDTGVGMSQGEIEQALKPFKQINALKRARGDGTGLGLPLTKALVEANRARFSISSAPGDGTLVEIVFPSTRVLAG